MTSHAWPILFVVLTWYFSTGCVLWLSRCPAERVPFRLLWITIIAAIGFAAAIVSSNTDQWWTPYLATLAAVSIWAWAEFTFLTGLITGPHEAPCPQNISEWHRFKLAFHTISRHEYGLVLALMALGLVCWNGENFNAFAVFATLWLMRISAKLVLFNGVPDFSSDMMPSPITHMKSYFRVDRIGPVFWVATLTLSALAIGALIIVHLGWFTFESQVIAMILVSFVGLAAFEHWMMVLPWRDSALWNWAMGAEKESEPSSSVGK